MKRKIEDTLKTWHEGSNKALLVKGARQIGKTYSIDKYLRESFAVMKSVNFANNASALEAFSTLKHYDDFQLQLALLFGDVPNQPDIAVFFDEIQIVYRRREEIRKSNPDLFHHTVDPITLIKEAVQKDKRRYVFSGSLLGVAMAGIGLEPAGYMDIKKMYPMDFEEFLWAKGVSLSVIEHLKDCFIQQVPVNESVHRQMLDLFKEFVIVGGMPEAVRAYLGSGDFGRVENAQEQILGYYHRDIVTYTSTSERLAVQEVFDSIPSELNAKNKRFMKSSLDLPNAKNLDITDRFLWLGKAGVALPVYNVGDVRYPLRISEQRKTLKLFMSDVGLLSCLLLGEDGRRKMLSGEVEINYGAPYENAIAQELTAHGYPPLHYWNAKKSGEIDFVIEDKGEVLPLEIKSGKSNIDNRYNHAVLDNCLKSHDNMKRAFVFSLANGFRESERVYSYPIYLIAFLKSDRPNPFDD